MPRLLPFTSKKLIKILESLGFQLDHTTGSHFIFYNAKTKKRVVVPYHTKDLPKGTVLSILKEGGITRKEFEEITKKK